jgi:hypothetical protein
MPNGDLPPDPGAVEKWRDLPEGTPSKEAMPPATGGASTIFGLVIPRGMLWIFLFVLALSLIIGAISKLL